VQSLRCGPFVRSACATPFGTSGISEHDARAVPSQPALPSAACLQRVPLVPLNIGSGG